MSIFGSIMKGIFPKADATTLDNVDLQDDVAVAEVLQETVKDVDVAAILTVLEAKSGQKLNWKTSIVDLMKLLGLDSSLSARKALAQELNYEGDMSDSATMNIWLHKQIMTMIAKNGGVLPADLQ